MCLTQGLFSNCKIEAFAHSIEKKSIWKLEWFRKTKIFSQCQNLLCKLLELTFSPWGSASYRILGSKIPLPIGVAGALTMLSDRCKSESYWRCSSGNDHRCSSLGSLGASQRSIWIPPVVKLVDFYKILALMGYAPHSLCKGAYGKTLVYSNTSISVSSWQSLMVQLI